MLKTYTREQRIAGLIQNGISASDLQQSFEEGRKAGFVDASEHVLKAAYAGICLALNDEYGFGKKRVYGALRAVDEKIVYALHHTELTDEVLARFGIRIDFQDTFNRVKEE